MGLFRPLVGFLTSALYSLSRGEAFGCGAILASSLCNLATLGPAALRDDGAFLALARQPDARQYVAVWCRLSL